MDAAGLGSMPKQELHPHQSQARASQIITRAKHAADAEPYLLALALALSGSAFPLVPSCVVLRRFTAFSSTQRRRHRRDDGRLDHPLQVWRAGDRGDRRNERALQKRWKCVIQAT